MKNLIDAQEEILKLNFCISKLKESEVKINKIKLATTIEDVQAILLGFNNNKEKQKFEQKEKEKQRREEIKSSEFNNVLTNEEKKHYIKKGEIFCSEDVYNYFHFYAFLNIDFGRKKYYSVGKNSLKPNFKNQLVYTYKKGKINSPVYELIADFFLLERENEIIFKFPNQEIKKVFKPNLPPSLKFDKWKIINSEENIFPENRFEISFNPFKELKQQLLKHKEFVKLIQINDDIYFIETEKNQLLHEISKLNLNEIEKIKKNKHLDSCFKSDIDEIIDYKTTPFFQE